jgi:uncharacterized membrane protein
MEQNPVMVLVGIYGSETDAKADYDDVKRLNSFTTFGIFDAAVITRDGDGRVRVNKDEKTTRQGALVGAVVGILFPPLLVADVAVGALAGHLWGGMSRADMRDLGELLDEGEVALVVVAEVEREGSLTKEFKRASRTMHRYIGTGTARIRGALDGREPEHVTR